MWQLKIENVAGIRRGVAEHRPGTNVIQASNWQGKTSLMTALRVVMGTEITPDDLTDGETRGHVELKIDDATDYRVDLQADGNDVVRDGTPYLTEPQDRICAELFAFLDGRNEIRDAVRNGADLTPLLTRPLEEEDIEAQVAELKAERRRAEAEHERATEAADELRRKEEQVRRLETELESLRAELSELESDDEASPSDETRRDELSAARASRERTQQTIDRQERQIESIESEIEEKKAALERLSIQEEPGLQSELEQKRSRLGELEDQIDTLQTLYNTNEQILERDHLDLVADVDRQISGDTVTCWVCDTEVSRDTIETQLAELSDTIGQKRETAADLDREVDELEDRQRRIEQKRQRRVELERDISTLQSRRQERQDNLISNREKLEELTATIEELEAEVEETDNQQKTLEEEIIRKETTLEERKEEVAELEHHADRREAIESQIEEITAEIEALRSRRERTIEAARTAFDAALEDVVDSFGPSFQAARLDKHTDPDTGRITKLELVIARDSREVSVNMLSEGEVELVGFIVAMAGYEAFDVADRVPCILLDDIGGLASDHLHTLVEYLESRTEYLVTSAYPEAGEFDGHTISPADWAVVSDRKEARV